MYSLFIDSHATDVVLVLYKDYSVLDKFISFSNNQHSVMLLPSIDKLLKGNNIDVHDLNEIYVVNGPGSFTGERLAVTIAKTLAYSLSIPIKVIDSLLLLAVNIDGNKTVAVTEKNGAFIGVFDQNNKPLKDYFYLNKNEYLEYKEVNEVVDDIEINFNKVASYLKDVEEVSPHGVKPLYIKGISALNDK